MIHAFYILWLAKCTSQDKVMLNSEEIEPVTTSIVDLRMAEGISELVRELVSTKFGLIELFKIS